MRSHVLLAASLVSLLGCGHAGQDRGAGDPGQPRSVEYAVPPEAPRGRVYVMSLGVKPLQVAADRAAPYLHLRLAADNNGDPGPWQFDPNRQVALFDGGAPVAPAYAQASTGGPVLTIAAGQRGHLDLYYPLPGGAGTPQTTLHWQLARGDTVVANTTVFQAVRPDDRAYALYEPMYRPRVGVHLRFGPGWWWGPDPWLWGYWGGYYHPWGPFDWGPRYYDPRPYRRYGIARPRPPVVAPPAGGSWRSPPASSSPAPQPRAAPPPDRGGKSDWRYR